MKAGVLMIRLAVMTIASAAGLAHGAAEPQPNSSSSASLPSQAGKSANAAASPDAAAFFRSLAGEWEGSIQSRSREGMTSSSVASASCRLENGGKRLACGYEGFAFGQPTEGGLVLAASSGAAASGALCRDGATMKAAGTLESGAMKFSFERSDHGKTMKYEQVLKAADSSHFTLELFSLDASDKKTLAFKLDMTRLESGEKSGAAEMFDKSKPLANARAAVGGNVQQAGVDGER